MNTRIKRLVEQCKEHPYALHKIDLEEFAELLIRECMRQVKEIQRLDGVLKNKIGIDFEIDVAKEVLKNFGVE